jgi:hypothetical protein
MLGNLMGFASKKRCQIIFLKMFVLNFFQLVKPFLANLILLVPNNSHMYSMTPNFFLVLFAYEEAKKQNFTLISNLWK